MNSKALPLLIALMVGAGDAVLAEPILWYDFDDPIDPARNLGTLGATWDGDLINEAHYTAFGSGFAVALDGNSDWVFPLGSESAFDIGNGDFTIYTRMQTTLLETGCGIAERGLVWKEKTGVMPGYTFGVIKDSGLPRLTLADGAVSVMAVGAVPVNDGVPHDLHAVRRGDALLVFEDGRLTAIAPVPLSFGNTNNDNRLVIGGRTINAAGCSFLDDFNGLIDEVRIHAEAVIPTCSSAPQDYIVTHAERDLISWCVPELVPAFDVVRGNLASLGATAGDFSLATETCLAAALGDDTDEPSQIGSRDAEIAASGHDCP